MVYKYFGAAHLGRH